MTAPSADIGGRTGDGAGLYLHVPFCETKCGYCDFYSVAVRGLATKPLIERVGAELATRCGGASGPVIRTIFFGGGTPTVLPPDELAWLFDAVAAAVPPGEVEEFTVEANPATVAPEKARLLVDRGVTRVSMGAQSFFPSELAALERLHTPDDIAPSVATLRRAGVRRINLDLIFGIPGQTMASWKESLRRAIDLAPDHIACYGLTYEPNTKLTAQLRAGRVMPCDEDLEADMYLLAMDTLESAGFGQYEISNFALPGCACRHNLMYWRNQPYIGVGPSAAGFVNGRRYKNVADIAGYTRRMDTIGHAEAESEVIDRHTLAHEMVLMQLRLNEGLSLEDFRHRTGLDPIRLMGSALERLANQGLLIASDARVALSRDGRLVADAVIRELVEAFTSVESIPAPAASETAV